MNFHKLVERAFNLLEDDESPSQKTINHYYSNKNNYHSELVPTKDLLRYREYDRSRHEKYPGHYDEVKNDIAKNGIKYPGTLHYDHKTHKTYAGEGNTRISAAHELGITHVPMKVDRMSHNKGFSSPKPHPNSLNGTHVGSEIRPSEIGFSTHKRDKE